MHNKFTKILLAGVFGTTLALPAFGDGHSYGPFPITLKGYTIIDFLLLNYLMINNLCR